jgi:hypothetical protein
LEKNIPFSMRVTPQFKRLLELAAARDCRSQTNLLEKLLLDYCRSTGLLAPPTNTTVGHPQDAEK